MRQLYAVTSVSTVFAPSQIQSLSVNANGTLNFNDWQGVSILPGFKWLTTKGATGTVSLGCSSVLAQGFFCVAGQSAPSPDFPTTYTLIDTVQVK